MTFQISRLMIVIGVISVGLFIASTWLSPAWERGALLLVFSSEAIRAMAVSRRTAGFQRRTSLVHFRTAMTFLTVLSVQMLLTHGELTRKAVNSQCMFALIVAFTLGYAQVFWFQRQDRR